MYLMQSAHATRKVSEPANSQGLRMKKSEDLESEIGIKGCAAALAT
jgi:hypothetical protein